MRKFLVVAAITLAAVGCDRSKQQLTAALSETQRVSAEKDSLLNEVLANAELVNSINVELSKVKGVGANPVAPGEAAADRAGEDRQVVLGKIRDVIVRLNESDAQLEKTKQRLNAMTTKDRRLVAQVDRYQKSIAELKATVERQQAEYLAIIDSQNTQIVALRTDLDTTIAQRTVVETAHRALTDTVNTVYFIAGTKDELIERGVAVNEGSKFLFFGGKRLEPARGLSSESFATIHRMRDSVITLPRSDKKYKIVSRHNPEYLSSVVGKDGKLSGGEIRIAQPEKFWAASPYLIVVQD